VLEKSGFAERVEQASVIPEWPGLVGPDDLGGDRADLDRGGRDTLRGREDERRG
jgi:hypothetical protein